MAFRQELKKVGEAKSLDEFLLNMPDFWLELVLALPGTVLALSPAAIFLIRCFLPDYSYDVPLNGGMAVTFALAALLYTGRRLVRGERFSLRLHWPLLGYGLLLLWMTVGSLVNREAVSLFRESPKYQGSLYSNYLNYLLWFTGGWLVRNPKLKKLWLGCFLFSGVVLSATALLDRWVFPVAQYHVRNDNDWVMTVYNNPNYFAYYLCVQGALTAALYALGGMNPEQGGGYYIFIFALHTATLAVNKTFGSWLALAGELAAAVAMVSLWKGKFDGKTLVPLGVFLGLSLGISLWDDHILLEFRQLSTDLNHVVQGNPLAESAGAGRGVLWNRTAQYVAERPLFGHGYDVTTQRLALETSYMDPEVRPHNEFLEYACFFGIPAAVLYVGATLCVYLRALKYRARLSKLSLAALLAALAYLASSLVGCQVGTIIPYLFLSLGLGYQLEPENGK